MNIFLTMTTLFAISMTVACSAPNAPEVYPASEDTCNQSCNFDHAASSECTSKSAAQNYLVSSVLPALFSSEELVLPDNLPEGIYCVCGSAKLQADGRLAEIKTFGPTDIRVGKVVESTLAKARFDPVPEEASCLLEEKNNLIPISFGISG